MVFIRRRYVMANPLFVQTSEGYINLALVTRRIRLYPARAARRHRRDGSAAGDAVAKVATRPLLNCANVRGATANLKLTFHVDHSAGGRAPATSLVRRRR